MSPKKQIIEDLGSGLVLRRADINDAEALVKFNGEVQVDPGEEFVEGIAEWVRDLMTKPHPTFKPEDFTIVENTKTREIASSLNLISQTWDYGGIPFEVGRPELVGTHPDYRRRGLIRKQFEVIHKWSAERGEKVQAITGIPWYYRQFEYEMCINLGGGRRAYENHVPKLKKDEKEPFKIRPAEEDDIEFLMKLYNQNSKRSLISSVRTEANWIYELTGRGEKSAYKREFQIIQTRRGKSVGYIAHPLELWGPTFGIDQFEVIKGVSWLDVAHTVMRYMQTTGEAYAEKEKDKEMTNLYFNLGEEHPAFDIIGIRMPRVNEPYAWYIRLPDIPDFLQLISPVLEERLAKSYIAGHSDEIALSFYTSGVKIMIEKGKIKAVEPWDKPDQKKASALFPDLTFLQVLFGYRSLEEIHKSRADCYCGSPLWETRVIINTLFPKKASNIWALG